MCPASAAQRPLLARLRTKRWVNSAVASLSLSLAAPTVSSVRAAGQPPNASSSSGDAHAPNLSGLDGSSPDSAIQDLPTLIPEAGVPMALALDAPSSEAGFDAVAQNAPASTPLSPEAKKPQAPTSGAPPSVTAPDETPIPVDVVASRVDLLGTAETASQGSITKEEIDLRPAYRVGQVLETVPGLVVTVHSGEGKANQFMIRGFNLDHGTDFATFVDDMPVNQPTNAHGQGYTDVHFFLPELAAGLNYTKGPFYPNIGDFGALGSAHIRLVDDIPTQISVSAGTLGDYNVFMAGTEHLANGDRLLGALNYGHVDGPWTNPDDFNSYNGIVRYIHGDQNDGFDLTAMAYRGTSNFTTDQPLVAFQEGLIGRFGSLDPSDGSKAERYSLSGHYYVSGDNWKVVTSGYVIHSWLTLWNDFTHFLTDPIHGDQAQQDETRTTFGGQTVYQRSDTIAGFETETDFGLQGRHDNIFVDRRHTEDRIVLPECPDSPDGGGLFVCNADNVSLGDVGVWVSNTTHWLPWFRTFIALREDFASGQTPAW